MFDTSTEEQIHIKFFLYSWDPECLISNLFAVALRPNAGHGLLILEGF
jgi:hypothetical protein